MSDKELSSKLEQLTYHGQIDLMYHEWTRYQSVNRHWINKQALWERWIRR